MARNNNKMVKRKFTKIEPSVKTMFFNLTVPGGGVSNSTVDISQCASLLNRRFYRQGLNWAVAGIKLVTLNANTATNIAVLKLPETWTMGNSWEKGYRSWEQMNEDALEGSESVKPRFLDFKIYVDSLHHVDGYSANLLPLGSDLTTPADPGEWEASSIFTPNSTDITPVAGTDTMNEFEVIAVGPNFPGGGASGHNAVSLIEGYAASRRLPEVRDPNAPADVIDTSGGTPNNWMTAMFNEGTTQSHEVLEDLITENNIAPYPFENDGVNLDTMYPNGANQLTGLQVHDVNTDTLTTVGGITRLAGGLFPCGLMRFSIANTQPGATSVSYVVQIDLVPGSHRGYLAEPMQDM